MRKPTAKAQAKIDAIEAENVAIEVERARLVKLSIEDPEAYEIELDVLRKKHQEVSNHWALGTSPLDKPEVPRPRTHLEVGDVVTHSMFGLGKIATADWQRISVDFEGYADRRIFPTPTAMQYLKFVN